MGANWLLGTLLTALVAFTKISRNYKAFLLFTKHFYLSKNIKLKNDKGQN
jgi:hypothetical protein